MVTILRKLYPIEKGNKKYPLEAQLKDSIMSYASKVGIPPTTLYIRPEDYCDAIEGLGLTVEQVTNIQPQHYALGDFHKEI